MSGNMLTYSLRDSLSICLFQKCIIKIAEVLNLKMCDNLNTLKSRHFSLHI
jgi:hypothetical protein